MPDSLRSRDRLAEIARKPNLTEIEKELLALVESQAQELAEWKADFAVLGSDVRDAQAEVVALEAELVRAERRQTVYLDLNAGMREALRDTLAALEGANKHIQEELQPEFQRLAEDGELTWPDAWHTTPYDESQAAMRLATWWHGVGTEETIDRARAALAGEGGPAAEEDG